MNKKELISTLTDFCELGLYILWGAMFMLYITSFPNPVSDAVYAWKFTAEAEPINAQEEFVAEMNSMYKEIQDGQNKEFGYCLKIQDNKITDYQEARYGERSNAKMSFECRDGEWNGFIHSQPISCRMSNNDMVVFGFKHEWRYFGLICEPDKMFFLDKQDKVLNKNRHPVQTMDFK